MTNKSSLAIATALAVGDGSDEERPLRSGLTVDSAICLKQIIDIEQRLDIHRQISAILGLINLYTAKYGISVFDIKSTATAALLVANRTKTLCELTETSLKVTATMIDPADQEQIVYSEEY